MLNVGSSARLRLAGWEGETADAVEKNSPAVRGTEVRLAIGERNFQSPGWGGRERVKDIDFGLGIRVCAMYCFFNETYTSSNGFLPPLRGSNLSLSGTRR